MCTNQQLNDHLYLRTYFGGVFRLENRMPSCHATSPFSSAQPQAVTNEQSFIFQDSCFQSVIRDRRCDVIRLGMVANPVDVTGPAQRPPLPAEREINAGMSVFNAGVVNFLKGDLWLIVSWSFFLVCCEKFEVALVPSS